MEKTLTDIDPMGKAISDYYKYGKNKVDKEGKNGTKATENELDVYLQGAGDIKATDLAKIIIPIPSFAEQERIVSILDRFETLINDKDQIKILVASK